VDTEDEGTQPQTQDDGAAEIAKYLELVDYYYNLCLFLTEVDLIVSTI
jgi:hypothetical protein